MLRSLYLWFRFLSIFKNIDGLKLFAEHSRDWLIEKTTQKSISFLLKYEKLLVVKKHLLERSDRALSQPLVDYDDFFSIKKKVMMQSFLFWAIVLAEGFLNYISTLIFMPGEGLAFTFLRWGIAIVLTGAGVIIAEKLIESILPIIPYKRQPTGKVKNIIAIILWGFLIICIEIAIVGVSEARARDIEGGTGSKILYFGFIILSMVLPLVAGATRWDLMHYIDAYKNTLLKHKIEYRLMKLDLVLKKIDERNALDYKLQCTKYWDIFIDFRIRKENYNRKKKIEEDVSNHFCRDYDAFLNEVDLRYDEDIRERIITHMNKIAGGDTGVGNKLGQQSFQEN